MSALIVGGDSGIGSALLNAIPEAVGTSRRKESPLIYVDVLSPESYPTFNTQFDEIYYCVGVGGRDISIEDTINTNATKSIQLLKHLAPYVKDNGNIRVLSSIAGSLEFSAGLNIDRINLGYKMSKAALNIGVIKLHHEFPNINWQLLHPGFVRTRMTSGVVLTAASSTPISPEESAQKILKTKIKSRLSFVHVVTGQEIAW